MMKDRKPFITGRAGFMATSLIKRLIAATPGYATRCGEPSKCIGAILGKVL